MGNETIYLNSSVAGQTVGELIELSQRLGQALQDSLSAMCDINSRTSSDYIKQFTQEFIEFFGSDTEGALAVPQQIDQAAMKIAEITDAIITEDVNGVE